LLYNTNIILQWRKIGFMDMLSIINLATSVEPSRDLSFTVTVIVAGLGIVLSTLAVLIVVFYVFGAIMAKTGKKSKQNKPQATAPAPAPVAVKPTAPAPAPVVEQGISGEVVAAISAAVYSVEGGNAKITSITATRKQNPITGRNPWAQAAVINNTNPF
jgi:sodium pump decarboxylase gamma subunit